MHELSKIPYLGVGMGLRHEVSEDILAYRDEIDVVEIISENFFLRNPRKDAYLQGVTEAFPVIPHGVHLSIGGTTPYERSFLENIRDLTERLNASYYSDHFCISENDLLTTTDYLAPLWYTEEVLDHVCARVDQIQQFTGLPLVLENITAAFTIPEADYEEPEFIAEVCRRTGCGLLLDVTNVFINAYNSGTDAQKLLERYPMDHVVHIHLAGGTVNEHGHYRDTHSAPVHDEVWPLLAWTAAHAAVKAVIIERDQEFEDDFENMILKDMRHAREIMHRARS